MQLQSPLDKDWWTTSRNLIAVIPTTPLPICLVRVAMKMETRWRRFLILNLTKLLVDVESIARVHQHHLLRLLVVLPQPGRMWIQWSDGSNRGAETIPLSFTMRRMTPIIASKYIYTSRFTYLMCSNLKSRQFFGPIYSTSITRSGDWTIVGVVSNCCVVQKFLILRQPESLFLIILFFCAKCEYLDTLLCLFLRHTPGMTILER